ncbi:trypsin [Oesophagostomum dentatum]|uniref:Trypsin n=1 Tax=Oesophagostomum dentatum TaxID=61180 RepID=A0A0B1TFR4_OESDE|nr:trypsin [Oesophagostomum dentatum]
MRYFFYASIIVIASAIKITPCENERLKKTCGKTNRGPSFKSWGGRQVRKNEFPWLTSVMANGKICSGALISQRHVITAAHCVANVYHVNETEHCVGQKPGKLLRVDVGNLKKYLVHVGSGCSHPRKCHKQRNVAKVTPHPLYKMHCEKRKDIAIIEFDKDISESEATPICTANSTTEVQRILQAAGQGIDRGFRVSSVSFLLHQFKGSKNKRIEKEPKPNQCS